MWSLCFLVITVDIFSSRAAFARIGTVPPRGILLHGPPVRVVYIRGRHETLTSIPKGTGKTALAHAVANSCSGIANFISLPCGELVSKVVGQSERAIVELFSRARTIAVGHGDFVVAYRCLILYQCVQPCVLFLDQLEMIAPVRGQDTSSEKTFDR